MTGKRPARGEPAADPAATSPPDDGIVETGTGAESAAPAETPAAPPAADAESAAAMKDRWLRAEADLQNYRRRAQREAEEGARAAEERVMMEIIAALDDLDRALAAAVEGGAPESWSEGVGLTARRLREFLARQDVRVVDPQGEPFDPTLEEAILEMDAPEGVAPGTVLQVILKGYARGRRPLRAARVVVARAPEAGEDPA